MIDWLFHTLGLDDASGAWYLAWSGFVSDLAYLAIVGALVRLARRHTCHVHGCWRLGHLPVEGTPWVVCRRHHPSGAPTSEELARR